MKGGESIFGFLAPESSSSIKKVCSLYQGSPGKKRFSIIGSAGNLEPLDLKKAMVSKEADYLLKLTQLCIFFVAFWIGFDD